MPLYTDAIFSNAGKESVRAATSCVQPRAFEQHCIPSRAIASAPLCRSKEKTNHASPRPSASISARIWRQRWLCADELSVPYSTGERVESARPSIDLLDGIEDDGEPRVRAEMEQMDVEDPDSDNGSHRSLLTYRFSKRFTTFTNSLPTLCFPSIRRYVPAIPLPRINLEHLGTNRVVILRRLFGIFLIVSIVYVLVASNVLSFSRNRATMGEYSTRKPYGYTYKKIRTSWTVCNCILGTTLRCTRTLQARREILSFENGCRDV